MHFLFNAQQRAYVASTVCMFISVGDSYCKKTGYNNYFVELKKAKDEWIQWLVEKARSDLFSFHFMYVEISDY